MGVSSLPKTATRQRRGCDLNPGPSAPESSPLPQLGHRATRQRLQPPVKRKSSLRRVPRGCHDERPINTRRPASLQIRSVDFLPRARNKHGIRRETRQA